MLSECAQKVACMYIRVGFVKRIFCYIYNRIDVHLGGLRELFEALKIFETQCTVFIYFLMIQGHKENE